MIQQMLVDRIEGAVKAMIVGVWNRDYTVRHFVCSDQSGALAVARKHKHIRGARATKVLDVTESFLAEAEDREELMAVVAAAEDRGDCGELKRNDDGRWVVVT